MKRRQSNQSSRKTLLANLVLFLICWPEARRLLASLAAADWRYVHWKHGEYWSFGLFGGFSTGGFTGQEFAFGSWRLCWSIPEFGSLASDRAGSLLDLIGLIVAGWLLWRLLPESLRRVLLRKAKRWIARVEWLLPVSGRWARYLVGTVLVGTVLVATIGFLLLR